MAAEPDTHEHPAHKRHGLEFRARMRFLYHGNTPTAVRFRLAVVIIDLAIIAFFIVAPVLKEQGQTFYIVDYLIAALLAVDLIARITAFSDWKDWFRRPISWVDLVVLVSLLMPAWLINLGFLRILRLWTLLNSDLFWRTVGRKYDDTRVEEVTRAVGNLITFVFVTTGFVYTVFMGRHEGITGYVDALYFTVATLTTTGFGDITLPGAGGRLLSIAVMLVGITLFVRLGQSLLRPRKVSFPCPTCALQKHDLDAVHCKACGTILAIPDDG
ncbi:potassium channel family protein [Brevundimonas staleyi]|uniref:Potassium channel family protein n=1 Tax=Brevundimonas staleyi TaxID=74326 RepID=A0ABW0FTL9_9CAUL